MWTRSFKRSNFPPAAPVFGSLAPNTIRSNRAWIMAPAHIMQGSSVTYKVQAVRRWLSSAIPASRIAMISACADGSCRPIFRFHPRPMTFPSRTITAPTGTSSSSPARLASNRASPIQLSSDALVLEEGSVNTFIQPFFEYTMQRLLDNPVMSYAEQDN